MTKSQSSPELGLVPGKSPSAALRQILVEWGGHPIISRRGSRNDPTELLDLRERLGRIAAAAGGYHSQMLTAGIPEAAATEATTAFILYTQQAEFSRTKGNS